MTDFIRTTENRHLRNRYNIYGKSFEKNQEIYIYQSILDGIQFLMKLFTNEDEIESRIWNIKTFKNFWIAS